jgi:DNA-binding MarR family transcriptional regulator
MKKDTSITDLISFLKKDGGMGVLLAVDKEKGTIHKEFHDSLHISRATVTDRITQADELGLIEISRLPDDHGNAKRYVLTQMGRTIRVALESMGVDETYERYLELDRELENSTDEMIQWMNETHEVWAEKTFDSEFKFKDELKDEETYPGDDVPENFISYIEGELSIRESLRRSIEHTDLDQREATGKDEGDE